VQTEVVLTDPPDDPALFKSLRQRPRVAWPTVALLFVAYGIFGLSTYAFIHGNYRWFGPSCSIVWQHTFHLRLPTKRRITR
jgi:fatty acid desaturase